MKQFFICLVALWPLAAFANDSLIYQQDKFLVYPHQAPIVKEVAAEEADKEENKEALNQKRVPTGNQPATEPEKEDSVAPAVQPIEIIVEIRPERAQQIDWMFRLNNLPDQHGLVVHYQTPSDVPIVPENLYMPVDILSISPEGEITQIVPEIVLRDLRQPIPQNNVVTARLYLKAGAAETLGINPGDIIEHALFNPAPRVLR